MGKRLTKNMIGYCFKKAFAMRNYCVRKLIKTVKFLLIISSFFGACICTCFSVWANPPAVLPIDDQGYAWAFHPSSDGAFEQVTFQAPLGMGVTIQRSNDLTNWEEVETFYGLDQIITWNLFTHPQNTGGPGGGNVDPDPPAPRTTVGLSIKRIDGLGVLLGWRSLDTEQAVQHVISGLNPAPEWNSQAVTAKETTGYFYTIFFGGQYAGVTPENTQLGALDAAMVTEFQAVFPALNQEIINNTATAQNSPPPIPADPNSKGFYRLTITQLDSDGDGIPDSIELANDLSSTFSYDTDGDGVSDGDEDSDGDGLTDAEEAQLGTDSLTPNYDQYARHDIQFWHFFANDDNTFHFEAYVNPLYNADGFYVLESNLSEPFGSANANHLNSLVDSIQFPNEESYQDNVNGQIPQAISDHVFQVGAGEDITGVTGGFIRLKPKSVKKLLKIEETKPEHSSDNEYEVSSGEIITLYGAGADGVESQWIQATEENPYRSFPEIKQRKDTRVSHFKIEIVVPKLDTNGNEIPNQFEVAKELRVSKMEDALSAAGALDIDKDRDRFFVRIPAGANLNNVSIKLATVDNPKAAYNDDATEIDLAANSNGDLITQSLLLVSDDVDDDYAGNGVGVDDAKNDRTHKVQLGGKVQISSINVNGTNHQVNSKTSVPVKKEMVGRIILVGDAANKSLEMTRLRDIAKERYAQVGIVFDFTITTLAIPEDIHASFDPVEVEDDGGVFGDGGQGGTLIHEDVRALYDAAHATGKTEQITVLAVPDMRQSFGRAFLPRNTAPQHANYANTVILSLNRILMNNKDFTLAHEVGHVLTNHGHYGLDYENQAPTHKTNHNLMRSGTSQGNALTGSKRWYLVQEAIFQKNLLKNP